MLADPVDAETPEELLQEYADALSAAVEAAGAATVEAETSLDAATVEAAESDPAAVTVEDAAEVLALDDDRNGDDVLAEVRDVLLLGMSSAVLDVEAIAADLDGLDAGEIQAKVEGRHPMTLEEYARIRHYVENA